MEKEKKLVELDNMKNKINDFLPNFETYCDHFSALQIQVYLY